MRTKLRNTAQFSANYVLVLSIALATSCQAVLAQEKSEEVIEEVVVYGERSLSNLRSDLFAAQEDFFDVFNSLNSSDEFDIDCEFMTPLGERRRYHVCAPKFAARAQSATSAQYTLSLHLAAAQQEVPDFNAARSSSFPHGSRAQKKEKLMWSEMATLLSEHPEMRDALNKIVEAKDKYEDASRRN